MPDFFSKLPDGTEINIQYIVVDSNIDECIISKLLEDGKLEAIDDPNGTLQDSFIQEIWDHYNDWCYDWYYELQDSY